MNEFLPEKLVIGTVNNPSPEKEYVDRLSFDVVREMLEADERVHVAGFADMPSDPSRIRGANLFIAPVVPDYSAAGLQAFTDTVVPRELVSFEQRAQDGWRDGGLHLPQLTIDQVVGTLTFEANDTTKHDIRVGDSFGDITSGTVTTTETTVRDLIHRTNVRVYPNLIGADVALSAVTQANEG